MYSNSTKMVNSYMQAFEWCQHTVQCLAQNWWSCFGETSNKSCWCWIGSNCSPSSLCSVNGISSTTLNFRISHCCLLSFPLRLLENWNEFFLDLRPKSSHATLTLMIATEHVTFLLVGHTPYNWQINAYPYWVRKLNTLVKNKLIGC